MVCRADGIRDSFIRSVVDLLGQVAHRVSRLGGKGWGFARSPDAVDRWVAEALRDCGKELARAVVDESHDFVSRVHLALAWACYSDDYATKEVAGRFLSAVRRLRLVRAINRHPRRGRFDSLVRAIETGRATEKQMAIAQNLAREVAA